MAVGMLRLNENSCADNETVSVLQNKWVKLKPRSILQGKITWDEAANRWPGV